MMKNFDPTGQIFLSHSHTQRRSLLFLVGAAKSERRSRKCESLGGSRGMSPPPENFFNIQCEFVHSWMILSSNFVSFWRHFFGILSFDLLRQHCNGKKETL